MKQVEGLLQLLDEAQAEVRRFLKTEQTASALALLQQCQESAVHLGNLIEAEEGEGTAAVGLLEQYCEEIYQCYQKIERGEWENEYKIYKVLNRALIRAGNSIKKDIKVYKEMVFLPYKASMWDSMESIWRAAEKDEHTVAYVIPIPYYDRNPDGSLGAMHYEGSQYPAYVPVIQYGSYDFEARRPDAVYIHNPYDNGNIVCWFTSPILFTAKRWIRAFAILPVSFMPIEFLFNLKRFGHSMSKEFCAITRMRN